MAIQNNEYDNEYYVLEELKAYRMYHSKDETIDLMAAIIRKEIPSFNNEHLRGVSRNELSCIVSKIVIEDIDSPVFNERQKQKLIGSMMEAYLSKSSHSNTRQRVAAPTYNEPVEDPLPQLSTIIERAEKRLQMKNKIVTRLSLVGVIAALTLTVPAAAQTRHNSKTVSNLIVYDDALTNDLANSNSNSNTTQEVVGNDKIQVDFEVENSKNDSMLQQSMEVEDTYELNKAEVLSNYSKCKNISDILKRQKQLEGLHLKKKDKIYKNCKLSAPLQQFIYEQSIIYGKRSHVDPMKLFNFSLSIIYTETRGGFASSGEKSYNGPGNYDLGLTQQNTVWSVEDFRKKFNPTSSQMIRKYGKTKAEQKSIKKTRSLVRYNDYVNVVCFFEEYSQIAARFKSFNAHEFAGCYNGWLDWRDKAISRQYVNIFDKAYESVFTKCDYERKTDITKTGKQILKTR